MKPLKCYVFKIWCVWNGHQPTLGEANYYGSRLACVCCSHCHKLLRWL